jgi:hypothetical protein
MCWTLAGPAAANQSNSAGGHTTVQYRGKSVYIERYVGVIYGPPSPRYMSSTGDACPWTLCLRARAPEPKAPRHRPQQYCQILEVCDWSGIITKVFKAI